MEDLSEEDNGYWRQRSCSNWLLHGDRNIAYFHHHANRRRQWNHISKITVVNREVTISSTDIARVVVYFFSGLFTSKQEDEDCNLIFQNVSIPQLTHEEVINLEKPFTRGDILDALKGMYLTKAPSPMVYMPSFFRHNGCLVGEDISHTLLKYLNEGMSIAELNETYIALIPMIQNSSTMVDFRPISLCNVAYKIFSKVLVNRLKLILPKLIREEQSAFVS